MTRSSDELQQQRALEEQWARDRAERAREAREAAKAAKEAAYQEWLRRFGDRSACQRSHRSHSARPLRSSVDIYVALRFAEALHHGSGGFRRSSARDLPMLHSHLPPNVSLTRSVRMLDPGYTPRTRAEGHPSARFPTEPRNLGAETRRIVLQGRASNTTNAVPTRQSSPNAAFDRSSVLSKAALRAVDSPSSRLRDRFTDITSSECWRVHRSCTTMGPAPGSYNFNTSSFGRGRCRTAR